MKSSDERFDVRIATAIQCLRDIGREFHGRGWSPAHIEGGIHREYAPRVENVLV
jgi:hypothetical protein